jgi:type I restriction enzyme M protein
VICTPCCACPRIAARDEASLDIFWLKDDSLPDSDNLPAPGVIAQEIVEDLQAALEQFKLIAADLLPEEATET